MKIYAQETFRMPERGLDDLLALKPMPPRQVAPKKKDKPSSSKK